MRVNMTEWGYSLEIETPEERRHLIEVLKKPVYPPPEIALPNGTSYTSLDAVCVYTYIEGGVVKATIGIKPEKGYMGQHDGEWINPDAS